MVFVGLACALGLFLPGILVGAALRSVWCVVGVGCCFLRYLFLESLKMVTVLRTERWRTAWLFGVVVVGSVLCANVAHGWYPYSEKYQAWQKDRPMMYGALHNSVPQDHVGERIARMKAGGYNTILWWKPGNALHMFEAASKAGLEWGSGEIGGIPAIQSAEHIPGMSIVFVGDEPHDEELPALVPIAEETRRLWPNVLAFSNLSITNSNHDDYVDLIKPDVFSFDVYPFFRDGRTFDYWLHSLEWCRISARKHKLPYWAWIQAIGRSDKGDTGQPYRIPDEADVRFNIFTFLAHGGQGMYFFSYYGWTEGTIMDSGVENLGRGPVEAHRYENTTPSRAYFAIRDVAPEVQNLASALFNLRATGKIGYIGARQLWDHQPPTYSKNNPTFEVKHEAFTGFSKLRSAELLDATSDQEGLMVSFFDDEAGETYFMVVNLTHGEKMDKIDGRRKVRLVLNPSVKKIERLNRLTGQVEVLNTEEFADKRKLDFALEGGTGDLFKWHNGQQWALRGK